MTDRNIRGLQHKLASREPPLPSCAPCSRIMVLFRSAAIFLIITTLVGCERGPTRRETELTIRGLELYLAVLDEFKTECAGRFPADCHGQIDAIVIRFIPPGTSFQDAVAILRGAHFTVGRPESVASDKNGDKTERFAVQGDLKLFRTFVFGASAYVVLDIDRPNPEPTIVKQAGGFIHSSPSRLRRRKTVSNARSFGRLSYEAGREPPGGCAIGSRGHRRPIGYTR